MAITTLFGHRGAEYGEDVLTSRNAGQGHSQPTLIYLHGHGSDSTIVRRRFEELSAAHLFAPNGPVQLVTPNGPVQVAGDPQSTGLALAWFENRATGADPDTLLIAVRQVHELINSCAAQGGPVILGGFSQGAGTALAAATTWGGPPLKGLLLQSGFVPEGIGIEIEIGAANVGSVLVQHGRNDEVVPWFFSEAISLGLEEAGVEVTIDVDDGAHEVTSGQQLRALEWISSCVRPE